MGSSWRCWCVLLSALLLGGCLGRTPERAELINALPGSSGDRHWLEISQRLRLSPTMLEALDSGIPLRLAYRFDWCKGAMLEGRSLQLRYAPMSGRYELSGVDGPDRRFSQRSALLAALDRVRLPLASAPPADCTLRAEVALDLTALPTPLRFPALLEPDQWRLVSPIKQWPPARA
jgi:hypothetical protein